jgi:hypothetical protein
VGISSGFNKISEQLAWSGSSLPLNAGLLRLQECVFTVCLSGYQSKFEPKFRSSA